MPAAPISPAPRGRLAGNIMYFARALRAAGLPAGPGKVIDAIRAVEIAGVRRRDDFYWALHGLFVNRADQRLLFDQAFHAFWRNPKILEDMLGLPLSPVVPRLDERRSAPGSRRLADAFARPGPGPEPGEAERSTVDAAFTASSREILQKRDFDKMTAAEIAAAKRAIARMTLPLAQMPTRRFAPHRRGSQIDMRATLRASLRSGGGLIPLSRRRRRRRPPPIVVLCDISGSMGRYSRMLLHFMHALTNDRDRVHSFVFGTRLTNISRYLRHRDVDVSLEAVTAAVEDWSGGTRIGQCLRTFNRDWSRRVLGQGALVILITDGLDREAGAGLAAEMERLAKSCRRLIWLNPLLRYSGFEPKSLGVRAMLPHVDEFRPVHDLDSLAGLAAALAADAGRRGRPPGEAIGRRGDVGGA